MIASGVFKGHKGKVVAAEFHDGKVLVKIRLDENTLVEVTTDMIEQ